MAPGPFLASQLPCTQKPLVHWESLLHWSMQPLPLQPLRGAQERAPGAVHLAFWQVEAPVSLFAPELQLAPLHWVPFGYFWQAPLPSHLPLSPHMADPPSLHIPFGSAALAGVGVQVPRALGRAQVWQAPLQAVPQQTPSTQNVLDALVAAGAVLAVTARRRSCRRCRPPGPCTACWWCRR